MNRRIYHDLDLHGLTVPELAALFLALTGDGWVAIDLDERYRPGQPDAPQGRPRQ